jgi:hypothetical protein
MMKIRTAFGAAMIGLASHAHAHHGIVNFDLNRDLELRGVITDIAFVNPHSWLYLDVHNDDGTVTPWRCELRSATVLRRSGWSAEMFPPGMEVHVTGAPDRSAATDCYLSTIEFGDGRSMDRYGMLREAAPVVPPAARSPRLANGDPNISGDWAGEQRVMTDPRGLTGTLVPLSVAQTLDGELPPGMRSFPGARGTPESLADDPIRAAWSRPTAMPLTAAGMEAIEDFDPASADNPRLRCEPTNILFDWMFDTPVHRITQHDDTITIEYGTVGGLHRTIHMDAEAAAAVPAEARAPSLAGFSVGRWEDDVLIVETSGFAPGILSADGYTPHSDQLRVVERFSLDPATFALTREYVAEDPLYFVGQYTGSDTVLPADLPFAPDACDDRSFRVSAGAGASDQDRTADPAADTARRPWWRFRD